MKDQEVFPRSVVLLLIACGVALFALSIILYSFKGDPVMSGNRVQAGAYSVSAIGYGGFYDALQRSGYPVKRVSKNVLSAVRSRGTLIVGEPELERMGTKQSLKFSGVSRLLIVLPKWRGVPKTGNSSWIADVESVPLIYARQTLYLVAGAGNDVFRKAWPSAWSVNKIGISPSGSGVVQLIRSTTMRPIVGDSDGMLVGEIIDGKRKIWVLSDPDVMSNHGIFIGNNAAFMFALIDKLRFWKNDSPKSSIVFDESVHGFEAANWTPLRLLFSFPFIIVTFLICCSAFLWVLTGVSRFGVPGASKRVLDFGKATLISNTARLLDYGGHHPIVLKRYVRMTVYSVGQILHAPSHLDEEALVAWLDTIGKAKGITRSCSKIMQETNELKDHAYKKGDVARLFESAWAIYCWKGELLNGSATHRRNRKKHQS